MHIPDGFLSGKVCIATALLSLPVIVIASKKLSKQLGEKLIPKMGMLTAFIFAAQMFNFPVAAGTSGHLMGGVLAMLVAGPAAGVIVLFCVLIVQCLFFQDGGITALGANTFNMAIVGVLAGYIFYSAISKISKNKFVQYVAVFTASWASIVLASLACATELSMSGVVSFKTSAIAMGSVHAIIGIGEATITLIIYSFLKKVSPEIFFNAKGCCREVA